MKPDVLERIFDGSIKPRDIKLSTLERITGNFSEDQKIGEGGFGTVYKGVLRNGEVAVKRIRNNYTIDEKLFRREVDSLLNVSHKNIVRFLGFCSNTEHKAIEYEGSRQHIYAETRERILCFEYINNGSLERYVADELRGLQWDTRYFIIKGICEGLQYLHMEMHIVHMDLKPANILIDYGMVAKITDFGLSRMEENSQTKSTNRTFSLGYTAPEYLHNGKMSVKSDVYSLGIIIIELVTGHRSIPDNDINNVLRRWRNTLRKSGEELPFRYQQITKLIEIGLLCQEEDPCKRPFINEIINGMNKLESMEREISNLSKSTVGQISAYSEDDMLGIEPLELRFPFELNNQISCSLELTNETNSSIAFSIQTTIPLPYRIQPNKGIVSPRSKYSIDITLQPIEKAPQDKLPGDFIVRSTKVKDHLKSEDITEDIFKKEEGKLVDEVNLTVTYKAEIPQLDESLRSPIISDTRNLHGPQESTVPQTKEDSVTSDEVIEFDPPKICFPLVPDKNVLSSIKIINTTESYVSVCFSESEKNTANYYFDNCTLLLPPRSKDNLVTVTKFKKDDEVEDMQFNDGIYAWYAIVAEDIKPSDLDWPEDYSEWKNLPIVLTKVDSCTSNELVQFDPPVLSFPCVNKTSCSSVNIVNITDCYVGFNTWWFREIDAEYETESGRGILPPGSTQRMVVKRIPYEERVEDMQFKNNIFVWNMIVAEGVEASSLKDFYDDEDSTEISFSFQTEQVLHRQDTHEEHRLLDTIKRLSTQHTNLGWTSEFRRSYKVNLGWTSEFRRSYNYIYLFGDTIFYMLCEMCV